MLITTPGTSCTGVLRGYDGTSAVAHSSGATIEHCLDAHTLEQLSAMANAPTSQYDLVMRGSTGASWSRIGVGSNGQALVVSGGVPGFGQLQTAGIADSAITSAKIADGRSLPATSQTTPSQQRRSRRTRSRPPRSTPGSREGSSTSTTPSATAHRSPPIRLRSRLSTCRSSTAGRTIAGQARCWSSTVAGDIANVWLRNTTTSTNLAVAGSPALTPRTA